MSRKLEDKEKVRTLLKYYKTNQTDFATRLGVSQSALAHWITRNKIPFPMMHKIADVCEEIAFSWLVTGMGPMLLKDGGKTELQMVDDGNTPANIPSLFPEIDCDEYIYCQGMSLAPIIQQGDYIWVKGIRENELIDPERVYLLTMDDGTEMIRYIAELESGEYELSADTTRRTLKVNKDKVKQIRKIVFVGKPI